MNASQKAIHEQEPVIDVVEICALLQCLGFAVKSLYTNDVNTSEDGGSKAVVISCQSSGLNVVLEGGSAACSCPTADHQASGLWQVSGMSGGKHAEKETGSTLLGSLPRNYREQVSHELREIVRGIKDHCDTDLEDSRTAGVNKSTSMVDLGTPEKRHFQLKVDTPTRYRSLDTLTSARDEEASLPAPGALQKLPLDISLEGGTNKGVFRNLCRRRSTYIISSAPGILRRNVTSSPIQRNTTVMERLVATKKAADDISSNLEILISEMADDERHDSSMSSVALDVSLLKEAESKVQFTSSPNLFGAAATHESLKRSESASVSNLRGLQKMKVPEKEGKLAKFKRLSPSLFKKKESDKDKTQDGKSKLNALSKPRIITPVRIPKPNMEPSPNLSSSNRKKYSHVKSTIPRPTIVKKN